MANELSLPPSCQMTFPVCQAHLIDRPGVPGVDQQVAVGVQVHRVDVEPVPRGAGRGRQRLLALAVRDMVGAVPLEQHPAGTDIDLLHDPVNDLLVWRAADGSQVGRGSRVSQDQRGIPGGDEEFVPVRGEAVAGLDPRDGTVMVVVDVVGPAGQAAQAGALPPGEDPVPPVGLGAEVCRFLPGRHGVEPDHVTSVIDDLRAVRVAGCVPERGDKDVPVAVVGARGEHGDGGRRGRGGRCGRPCSRHREGGGKCCREQGGSDDPPGPRRVTAAS